MRWRRGLGARDLRQKGPDRSRLFALPLVTLAMVAVGVNARRYEYAGDRGPVRGKNSVKTVPRCEGEVLLRTRNSPL